ncbi:MAG: peptidase C11 [Lachnospiraceae bacterium]|nr:peptidase C11 [Lachnospiraceae bacterium]
MANRPTGHGKNVLGGSAELGKKGSALGSGPVGTGSGGGFHQGGGGPMRSSGGGGKLLMIIVVIVLLLGGGKGLSSFMGGSSSDTSYTDQTTTGTSDTTGSSQSTGSASGSQSSSGSFSGLGDLVSLLGSGSYNDYYSGNTSSQSGSGMLTGNVSPASMYDSGSTSSGMLDSSVAEGAREKRTVIKGNGEDKITIMVYMCGTDLESRSGMATSDIMEMTKADISDNINLLVFTGGCSRWQNNVISSSVNQIYRVRNGGLECIEKDAGTKAMTDPSNLSSYIQYCAKKYPADRYELIFWDHGGGSLSGYGYDEKNKSKGSMKLADINEALKSGGVTFDFIGFDTCLMATLETALIASQYGDYMIASEETEPGVGWYYTEWLSKLSKNTSMPTAEIGKNIVDDFVTVCNQKCPGQKTTLSVIDLAELETTIPDDFKDFSQTMVRLITDDNEYKVVSDARYGSREFAQSSKIDQIDLVDFATRVGTDEGKELAESIKSAVKYNRTSSSISNAYGLSIYFPYKKTSGVNSAVSTYDAIGMDSEYTKCIQEFASLQLGGQVSSGYEASPFGSLMGSLLSGSSSSSSSSYSSADMIGQMLGGMLSGNLGSVSGLDQSALGFLSGRSMSTEDQAEYIYNNHLDQENLIWLKDSDGDYKLGLTERDWDYVHALDLNVFYDDGEGYVDLGLDNVFEYDDKDKLIGKYDNTWLTLNGRIVAYYHTDDEYNEESFTTSGYIPVLLNGERAELIVVYNDDNPDGYIAGARYVYEDSTTDTIAKNLAALETGDELEFIFDYYDYNGNYRESYVFGDPLTLSDKITLGYMDIGNKGKNRATYKLTDIYEQAYWTPVIPD